MSVQHLDSQTFVDPAARGHLSPDQLEPRDPLPRQRHGRITGTTRVSDFPRVSVVIPALNEALNLPLVLAELPDVVDEVVVVDGHSTDGTPEAAIRALPDARVVVQSGRGKGDAMRCGFEAATGDVLVMMDADGSADPAEIPRFVQTLLDGADFAKGTRFAAQGGSSDLTPVRYGYNAFWRHCLPAMNVDCQGFEIETLINIRIGRAGLDVREVPSFERDRIHGESNLRTFRDGARVLRTILRERVRRMPHEHHSHSPAERHVAAELGLAGEHA
jgi:glycosyltransferase involved in cell wall biosynthesis